MRRLWFAICCSYMLGCQNATPQNENNHPPIHNSTQSEKIPTHDKHPIFDGGISQAIPPIQHPATPPGTAPAPLPKTPESYAKPHDTAADTAPTIHHPDTTTPLDSFPPLTPTQKQHLDDIPWDTPPETLDAVKLENRGGHFLHSDEKHPDLFFDTIANIGGIYVGIGTDQGYLFIGWQRPTLAFLVDYDPWVIFTHQYYMALIQTCETRICFRKLIQNRDEAFERLKSNEKFALHNRENVKIFKEAHRAMYRAMAQWRRLPKKTFFNDDETYAFIRSLILQKRIRTFQANLLGDTAFQALAQTLKTLNAKITTLYLSNAEQYWPYTQQYKDNMTALPYAENAIIMRTSATYPSNHDYRYSIQPANVFTAWLASPNCKSVKDLSKRPKNIAPDAFPFTIDNAMPPSIMEK